MPYAVPTPPANVSWHAPQYKKPRVAQPHQLRWRPLESDQRR